MALPNKQLLLLFFATITLSVFAAANVQVTIATLRLTSMDFMSKEEYAAEKPVMSARGVMTQPNKWTGQKVGFPGRRIALCYHNKDAAAASKETKAISPLPPQRGPVKLQVSGPDGNRIITHNGKIYGGTVSLGTPNFYGDTFDFGSSTSTDGNVHSVVSDNSIKRQGDGDGNGEGGGQESATTTTDPGLIWIQDVVDKDGKDLTDDAGEIRHIHLNIEWKPEYTGKQFYFVSVVHLDPNKVDKEGIVGGEIRRAYKQDSENGTKEYYMAFSPDFLKFSRYTLGSGSYHQILELWLDNCQDEYHGGYHGAHHDEVVVPLSSIGNHPFVALYYKVEDLPAMVDKGNKQGEEYTHRLMVVLPVPKHPEEKLEHDCSLGHLFVGWHADLKQQGKVTFPTVVNTMEKKSVGNVKEKAPPRWKQFWNLAGNLAGNKLNTKRTTSTGEQQEQALEAAAVVEAVEDGQPQEGSPVNVGLHFVPIEGT